MKLKNLEMNKVGKIEKLNTNDSIKRRLLDLGIIKGTKIIPVLKSPSGGSRAYEIRQTLIAIRDEDACKIQIKQIEK